MGRMMNLLELGALLKDEREKRGLSLRDVMEATKISRRNLTALEGGEVEQLPHPVYLKGYVRNYAKLVGLEAEPLVSVVEAQTDGGGYLPQTATSSSSSAAPAAGMTSSASAPADEPASSDSPEPAIQPSAASASGPQESSESSESSVLPDASAAEPEPVATTDAPEPSGLSRAASPESTPPGVSGTAGRPSLFAAKNMRAWPWVVLLVIALLAVLVYVQYRRVSHEMDAAPANATTAAPANATAVPAPAPAAPAENVPAPEDNASAASANPAEQAGQANPADASADQSAGSSFDGWHKAGPDQTDQGDQSATPGKQLLVVTAKPNEVCWVSLSEGGHHKTFMLKNGDSRRFEFSKKAKLRLGNAGGVTVQLNGAPYPFEGQRGSTATLEIGAK